VSVGGLLALDQVLGDTWSCLTILGLRQPVKGGVQEEEEIMGYRTLFGSILGFWDYVTGMGCRPMGLPMLRPILYL
jgi:hypothetical protein